MAAEAAAAAAAAPGSSLFLSVCPSQQWILGDRLARTGNVWVGNAETFLPRWEGETGTNLDTVASACFSSVDRRREDRPGGEGDCATSSKKKKKKSPPSPKEQSW